MTGQTLRLIRRWHLYIAMFFMPLLLLFAVSGAIQTFRLNEAKGWGGPAPKVLVWIGAIHKDQMPPNASEEAARDAKWAASVRADAGKHKKSTPATVLALKVYVVAVAIGLFVSIVLGSIIAFTSPITRRPAALAVALGTLLPLGLILLQL